MAESSPWEQGARAGALQEQREGRGAQVAVTALLGQLGGAAWAAQSAATARRDGWTGQTDRRSRAPLGPSWSQLTARSYRRVQGFTHLLLEGSQEVMLTPAAAAAASPIGEEQPWEQLQGSSRGFI